MTEQNLDPPGLGWALARLRSSRSGSRQRDPSIVRPKHLRPNRSVDRRGLFLLPLPPLEKELHK
jgi:hypothetical protein